MAKIAVLGHGVVGSGAVELFLKNKASIEKRAGRSIELAYILDLRDFPDAPYADKFVKSIDDILADGEVKAVAECMGGVGAAYEFTKKCLSQGISVVTSNKELVATHGAELIALAKANDCNYKFEASVGGGIPIIRPLHHCLAANTITGVAGILNGTTNFILTKMFEEQMDFDVALKMAQELGYAERDPSADVEGDDACRKVCILASLAFGKHVYPKSVHTEGITAISADDIEYAESWGGKVKLIGSVRKLPNGKILPMVAPAFVPTENLLSDVKDVFNGIMVMGDAIEKVMFYGRGAGKFPTASAVVADLIDVVKRDKPSISLYWEDSEEGFVEDYRAVPIARYVRAHADDADSAKAAVSAAFEGAVFLCRENAPVGEIAFTVPAVTEDELAEKLSALPLTVENTIRILDI